MITLFSGHNHIKGENSCGCSNVSTLWFASAVELTLIVIGILAVAEVGAFQGYSQASSIIILASGGLVLFVDVIRAIVNWKIISRLKAAQDERGRGLAATGVTLHRDANDNYTIDLSSLIPSSDNRHIYPVLTEDVYNRLLLTKKLNNNEFIFYFAGASRGLDDVWMVRKHPLRDAVMPIPDWLINHDNPHLNDCIDGIRKGTLRHVPFNSPN